LSSISILFSVPLQRLLLSFSLPFSNSHLENFFSLARELLSSFWDLYVVLYWSDGLLRLPQPSNCGLLFHLLLQPYPLTPHSFSQIFPFTDATPPWQELEGERRLRPSDSLPSVGSRRPLRCLPPQHASLSLRRMVYSPLFSFSATPNRTEENPLASSQAILWLSLNPPPHAGFSTMTLLSFVRRSLVCRRVGLVTSPSPGNALFAIKIQYSRL